MEIIQRALEATDGESFAASSLEFHQQREETSLAEPSTAAHRRRKPNQRGSASTENRPVLSLVLAAQRHGEHALHTHEILG